MKRTSLPLPVLCCAALWSLLALSGHASWCLSRQLSGGLCCKTLIETGTRAVFKILAFDGEIAPAPRPERFSE